MAVRAASPTLGRGTAENHKYNIKEKLKLKSTAELTQYAIGQGLIQPLGRLS